MSSKSIGASLVFLLFASWLVFACKCQFPDVPTAVQQADLVFRGKLVKVEYVDQPQVRPRRFLATFEVTAVWKGNVSATIVLHTQEPSQRCGGFSTETDREFLVFAERKMVARRNPEVWREWQSKVADGQVINAPGVCTLNSLIESAGRTLISLGLSHPPVRPKPD